VEHEWRMLGANIDEAVLQHLFDVGDSSRRIMGGPLQRIWRLAYSPDDKAEPAHMSKRDSDWTYWTGWFAAFALMAAFFLICLFLGWFDRPVCVTGESNTVCFREWMSATGGWSALPIAAISVLFLTRQIKGSEDYNRRMLAFSHQPTRSTAVKAMASGVRTFAQANDLANYYREVKAGGGTISIEEYREQVDELRELANNPDFVQFELQVPSKQLIDAVLARASIERFLNDADTIAIAHPPATRLHSIDVIARQIAAYASICTNSCVDYLTQISEMLGEDQTVHHTENAPSTAESSAST
jgi:hypothetical protein